MADLDDGFIVRQLHIVLQNSSAENCRSDWFGGVSFLIRNKSWETYRIPLKLFHYLHWNGHLFLAHWAEVPLGRDLSEGGEAPAPHTPSGEPGQPPHWRGLGLLVAIGGGRGIAKVPGALTNEDPIHWSISLSSFFWFFDKPFPCLRLLSDLTPVSKSLKTQCKTNQTLKLLLSYLDREWIWRKRMGVPGKLCDQANLPFFPALLDLPKTSSPSLSSGPSSQLWWARGGFHHC